MPDDNTNLDDDFFAELNADSATDEVAPFTSAGSENVSDDPFSSLEGFSEGNDPFGDAEAALAQEAAPVVDEVVGKKGKGKKAKKEKAPKEPKVKKEKIKKEKAPKTKEVKAPKPRKEKAAKRPYTASPAPFFFLEIVLVALLVVANVVAFMTAGPASATYLIILDVLGLVILAIPMMLLSQLLKRPVGIFDVFMALAAIFSVVSVIMIVTGQAKYFGASSKVTSTQTITIDESSETFFC